MNSSAARRALFSDGPQGSAAGGDAICIHRENQIEINEIMKYERIKIHLELGRCQENQYILLYSDDSENTVKLKIA